MSADALALLLAWLMVVHLRGGLERWWPWDLWPGLEPLLPPMSDAVHLPLLALVLPIWIGALAARGSYHALRRKQPGLELVERGVSVGLALLVLLSLLFVLKIPLVSRTVVVGFAAVSVPTLVATRQLYLALLRRLRPAGINAHSVLLVGAPGEASPWVDAVARHPEWAIAIAGRVDVDADLIRLLEDTPIDEVYLTGQEMPPYRLGEIAHLCDELGVRLSMDANFLGLRTARAELNDFDGWSVLTFSGTPSRGPELALKRAMDIGGAVVGLLVLAPLLAIIAVAVRVVDGGPAIFVQERAGRFGRSFRMYKFRTMEVGAEGRLDALRDRNEMSGPVFKLRDDPRLTPLGRLLRVTSLDELPQLVNVLRGEMSLVGPRPPLPSEVRSYERWQLRRLSMKPGLTCIWQVSGRSEIDFDRWMALDLEYIDNWSLWLDIRLLALTVPAVLSGVGAR